MDLFDVVWTLLMVGCIWWSAATYITYKQRNKIVSVVSEKATKFIMEYVHDKNREEGTVGGWMKWFNMVDDVSFLTHSWHVFTFRNPYKLYNEEIRPEGK